WQKTHYAWYKSKIKTGEIQVPGISIERSDENQSDDVETEVEESLEARISLERDLHSYLASRIGEIESELTLVENGIEYPAEAGKIDLLARDTNNHLGVIELKAGDAKDGALGYHLLVKYRLSFELQEVRARRMSLPRKARSDSYTSYVGRNKTA